MAVVELDPGMVYLLAVITEGGQVPDNVITRMDQVTPEWLTSVLYDSGALTNGAVTKFAVENGRGNWSANVILRVQYNDGSKGGKPRQLFLKMVKMDMNGEFFSSSEVTFYTHDYTDVADAPLVRCHNAACSEKLRRYHVLLDDVSETHIEAADKAPTLEYGLALAEGLAAMHARWWGAERLAEAGAAIHSAWHIRRFVDLSKLGAEQMLSHFSADLEPSWPAAIQNLYAKHPLAIIERSLDDHGFTLVHGDTGHHNILVPRVGDRPIYIIDRQPFDWALTTWLGAYDLAYAMVLDWDVETRRRLELPVLKHYHAQLSARGVFGYSWDRLYDDYRLCVAMCVYVATEYFRSGLNNQWVSTWLSMLQRSLTACDDLACSDLW